MFQKYNKICALQNVVRNHRSALKYDDDLPSKVAYRPKIKLHGTNSAIIVTKDDIVAQKRTDIATVDQDNYGFAAWVESKKDVIRRQFPIMGAGWKTIIYGEWAGPGIQKNVAVSKIEKKTFFVFEIRTYGPEDIYYRYYEPEIFIPGTIPLLAEEDDIEIIPWFSEAIELDLNSNDSMQKFVEDCNDTVEQIDKIDPYILDRFGIEGHGEGLVYYPLGFITKKDELRGLGEFGRSVSDYMFKVKGESHSVNKSGKPARVKDIPPDSFFEFVENVVTPARLEQAIQETGAKGKEDTGALIGWVCKDIAEEEKNALTDMGVTNKQMGGPVAAKVRKLWFSKLEEF